MQKTFYSDWRKKRLRLIFFIFIAFFSIILIRLIYLQGFASQKFKDIAFRQRQSTIELKPERGLILDRNGSRLAMNRKIKSVFINPHQTVDVEKTIHSISTILDIDEELLIARIKRSKYFAWIKRGITNAQYEKIKSLKIQSIDFIDEPKRLYPGDSTAAHIIGYTDIDGNGIDGIELMFDRYLKGTPGWLNTIVDARRREIADRGRKYVAPVNGHNVRLTIDENIQTISQTALKKTVEKFNAKGGMIIVMEPNTFSILAMCSYPEFDPNTPGQYSFNQRRNTAISNVFEPGSTFKAITACAVLEEKAVLPSTNIYCENGEYRVLGRILHDHKPHANLSFKDVITHSSNIGTCKAALKIGPEKLYSYIKKFGFEKKTNLKLPGEAKGLLRPVKRWTKSSMYAIPMGQEIATTGIQMAQAFTVIASDGAFRKPRIVADIRDEKGVLIWTNAISAQKSIVSNKTISQMKDILQNVVENGSGRRAQLAHYTAAGKTGTAQKVNDDGTYSHSKFVASFIGFAPVKDPAIVVAVMIDEPYPIYYGGSVSGPAFKEIADQVLPYMNIAHDEVDDDSKHT